MCKIVAFIVKTWNFTKKTRKYFTLQKQPFTDVSNISIFKNLREFTKKQKKKKQYRSLFLIKLQASSSLSIKKPTPAQLFSLIFCEIFKNISFMQHLGVTASDSLDHYIKIHPDIILKTSK